MLPIQDNPNLDREVNTHQHNNSSSFNKPRYCRKCGQAMTYSKKDKDGNIDPSFKWRWKNRICAKCFRATDMQDLKRIEDRR